LLLHIVAVAISASQVFATLFSLHFSQLPAFPLAAHCFSSFPSFYRNIIFSFSSFESSATSPQVFFVGFLKKLKYILLRFFGFSPSMACQFFKSFLVYPTQIQYLQFTVSTGWPFII